MLKKFNNMHRILEKCDNLLFWEFIEFARKGDNSQWTQENIRKCKSIYYLILDIEIRANRNREPRFKQTFQQRN